MAKSVRKASAKSKGDTRPAENKTVMTSSKNDVIPEKNETVVRKVDIPAATQYILYAVLVCRVVIQPLYSLISDCDETFNYWEPLNYMVRNFGKQTWEYSPTYSIRSWCFLLPMFNLMKFANFVGTYVPFVDFKPYHLFYVARIALGLTSYLVERQFFVQCSVSFSPEFGKWWLILQLFNPGYFHASVELLPSSFAMLSMIHSTNYFIKYVSHTAQTQTKLDFFVRSFSCITIGAIAGWPFVFVMIIPICLHFMFTNLKNVNFIGKGGIDVIKSLMVIVTYISLVDSYFYGKFTPVFLNIVSYNVFNATKESGPSIFGIEPWYYYFQNLVLNFPIVTLLALVVSFTIQFNVKFFKKCWPMYMQVIIWIFVFNNQPHKEERFMYPIYGLITFLATISFVQIGGATKNNKLKSKKLGCIVKWVALLGLAGQSFLRISSLVINYTGPLSVYRELNNLPSKSKADDEPVNVCVGREWYHYPNSFFLPDNFRLKFVSSGFDGLLPGDFPEDVNNWITGIRTIPEGMNNLNHFEENKIVGLDQCDYLIDVELDNYDVAKDAINESTKGEKLYCSSIIDVEKSKLLGRAFTVPFLNYLPDFVLQHIDKYYHVEYLDYCIYETN